MRAGSGHAHTNRAARCSSSFQHNIIRQQRSFRSVWSHTGFTAMGNKIKKNNFLATLAQNTNFFLCAREGKRRPGHNQSNDLLPGQQRHACSISSHLSLMFFGYVHNFGTHNLRDAFIQRNSMSAYFQGGCSRDCNCNPGRGIKATAFYTQGQAACLP